MDNNTFLCQTFDLEFCQCNDLIYIERSENIRTASGNIVLWSYSIFFVLSAPGMEEGNMLFVERLKGCGLLRGRFYSVFFWSQYFY